MQAVSWRNGSSSSSELRSGGAAAAPPLDPSVYSLGPNASIPEESFDESERCEIVGQVHDFTFDEDDDPPVAQITLPEPEDVASDEN